METVTSIKPVYSNRCGNIRGSSIIAAGKNIHDSQKQGVHKIVIPGFFLTGVLEALLSYPPSCTVEVAVNKLTQLHIFGLEIS
jgi:hypothetical protein